MVVVVWLKTEPILLILANPACLNADSDHGPDTTPPTLPVLQLPSPQNFTPEAGIGGTRSNRAYVYPQICLKTFSGGQELELKQERNTLSNRRH